METTIKRGHDKQLSATSYADLSNGMKLRIYTYKGSRGLFSGVQAVNITDNTESFVVFQDFTKVIYNHVDIKRVTESSITEAHKRAIADTVITPIIEEANKFYNV